MKCFILVARLDSRRSFDSKNRDPEQGGVMHKYAGMLAVLLLSRLSYAQFSPSDLHIRDEIRARKTAHAQQLMLMEQQKTSNQEDYDVTYYALDLIPNHENETLRGIVQIIGEVLSTTLEHVELNFWDGMSIGSVTTAQQPDDPLYYRRGDDFLYIDLDRVYTQGERFHLIISYNGQPEGALQYGSFGFTTYDQQPMIWSFSQPWCARAWWPCKDVPSDKADSVDIRVTVPSNLIVASNGALRQTITENGQTTYWWHEKYPIVTYNVFVAAYPYEVHYDDYIYNNGADTMKIHFYTFQDTWERYTSINEKVKDMIAFFSSVFGEYPFIEEKYGHADYPAFGAIEHQTCSCFRFWNEWVYAHELAHQWWGDMITYESWHHTWLGEGFATYSEALWYEHLHGPGTAWEYQMNRNTYYGDGTVYVEYPENEANVATFTNIRDNPYFPGLVYDKASWILHMLRHIVGDETFFNILQTFAASPDHRHGTVNSEDFKNICEQVSGMELDRFFHQWLHEELYPQYVFEWNWVQNGSMYDIQLDITQQQDNTVFWMPIDITVTTADGDTTFVVWDSLQTQSFLLSVSSEPVYLEIDRNNWILKSVDEPMPDPTFDRGVLLVNGLDIDALLFEAWEAYQRRSFWGDVPISFWDCFDPPASGYPATLPEPLGHGRVPANVLGQYSSVIWVGHDYNGDLADWLQTSIQPYLNAGGNLLLMTQAGREYIDEEMREYLGVTWHDSVDWNNRLRNCIATYPGLVDMEFLAPQISCTVFDTLLTNAESTLLFKDTAGFDETMGVGVWRKPASGGMHRPDGGQFVFISGMPFDYYWDQLRSNIMFILEDFFGESASSATNEHAQNSPVARFRLEQNHPNPFNATTTIHFQLPSRQNLRLTIYNLLGQEVIHLIDKQIPAGEHQILWNGKDSSGADVSTGVYMYVLCGKTCIEKRKMILLR